MKTRSKLLTVALGLMFSTGVFGRSYSDLWVFGDSFSDNGSTKKILPVLESLKKSYLPKNAKLADGKLWIEYFAEELGHAKRAESYWLKESRRPGNFSMIAASAMQDSIAIIDFPEAVAEFEREFERFGRDDLIVVQIGINDALEAMKTFGRFNDDIGDRAAFAKGSEVISVAMKSYKETMKKLIELGGRNFLILNSPDLGRAPFAGKLGVRDLARKYSQALNQSINSVLQGLNGSGVSIKAFDLFSNLDAILDAPESVGLSANLNVREPCGWRGPDGQRCENPNKYFYYDLNHPTSQVNRIIAKKALETLNR